MFSLEKNCPNHSNLSNYIVAYSSKKNRKKIKLLVGGIEKNRKKNKIIGWGNG